MARKESENVHYAFRLSAKTTPALSQIHCGRDVIDRLSYSSTSNNSHTDALSLKLSRLPSLSSLHNIIKRTNSISTIGTHGSRNSTSSNINISHQQSFTNNMIAKLASSGAGTNKSTKNSSAPASAATISGSSSQCQKKRQKLVDLLLNSSWSKQSQQAANLIKLHKVLLACDANFLDEKTGESPLSLAIASNQINATPVAAKSANRFPSGASHALASNAIGCPQSASLFNLQFQHPSTSHNQQTLQQTSAAEISQSKAPLVEKILLLLIKSGALIDFRNKDGRTPLHVAAMRSNSWALKTLLDLGASTDYRDINGLTPLYYSILHRAELKVTQLLLNHISNKSLSEAGSQNGIINKAVSICDQQGWQEVHHACKLGLDAHLDKLLYHGCDINAKISGSGNTPLHVAAINDQLQVAKILLLRGADRTITNNSHQTAHQVAVISNNMDLAEFIASHDEKAAVPFAERPNHRHSLIPPGPMNLNDANRTLNRFSMPPNQYLVNSQSTNQISSIATNPQQANRPPTVIVQPQASLNSESQHLNPLTLDVACHYSNDSASAGSSAPSTNTSGTGHHTAQSSLLSIQSSSQNHHLDAHSNNISPSLSQRSCGTSNTTSSGVCCDGEGANSDGPVGSKVQSNQTNITVIAIGTRSNPSSRDGNIRVTSSQYVQPDGLVDPLPLLDSASMNGYSTVAATKISDDNDHHDEDDASSSESSSNGLYSLMSSSRPLFAGSIVQATTDYQSGDPSHLQLRRQDMIEVLEYPSELLQGGPLLRMANKPMLFGRRRTDGKSGLFPSFCVRRTKQRQPSLRQRIPMSDLTNSTSHQFQQQHTANLNSATASANEHPSSHAIRGTNLPESQSMAAIDELEKHQQSENLGSANMEAGGARLVFKEYQVVLTKINDGFGFVLRGARINPATLLTRSNVSNGKIAIDERLMMANNLASLQYLDDIEIGSVANKAGLKRGDFLIAVNNQDVRLCSHENVVQMIRSSGDRVHLKIATPTVIPSPSRELLSSKTLTRVKPEPPKRDPTTTLTRNKSQKIRSMPVAPQVQEQEDRRQGSPFNANKPLPKAPEGHTNMPSQTFDTNGPSSADTSHLYSNNSLYSFALENQSVTSISTIDSADQRRDQTADLLSPNNQKHDQSSSSTATLTTVATTKPQAPVKPNSIYLKGLALKNSTNQPSYQSSAVVVSNLRQSQESASSKPLEESQSRATDIAQTNQLPPPPPPLPSGPFPPPPPLPNFSNVSDSTSRLVNRRTSAPTNQISNLGDAKRLLKKRESVATIGIDRQLNEAPSICAVAAACAAAANNRLQRQQQKQEQPRENHEEVDQSPSLEPSRNNVTVNQLTETETKSSADVNRTNDQCSEESRCHKQDMAAKREQSARVMQSATLGRKSSAQIIQQPKPNHCPAHSQTLRAVNTPKRMSILDYEMTQLPPPPPIPVQPITSSKQANQDMKHQHRHHDHQRHRLTDDTIAHQMLDRSAVMQRSQHEVAQCQVQNQHEIILRQSQQLRQQQLIQERLLAQQRPQHRVCQHNHNSSSGHHYSDHGPFLAAEDNVPANHQQHHHHHHHHLNHRNQHQQTMDAPSYLINQYPDQHNHQLTATMQHYHHQQQHIKQTHAHYDHNRQVPLANHYGQKATPATPYHAHRHSSHIQHDHQHVLHQHQQQHQRLLQQQQQQQQQQYLH